NLGMAQLPPTYSRLSANSAQESVLPWAPWISVSGTFSVRQTLSQPSKYWNLVILIDSVRSFTTFTLGLLQSSALAWWATAIVATARRYTKRFIIMVFFSRIGGRSRSA